MRDANGRYVKGSSGNPSGLPKGRSGTMSHRGTLDEDDDFDVPDAAPPGLQHFDGWLSAMTGIGTHSHDKRESAVFVPKALTYEQAIDIWRADDVAARAIGGPPEDCFREGYEIHISDEGSFDDLKEAVEKRMLELKVDEIVERALKYERAYGGAAILLGVKDGRALDEPLDPAKVQSLDYLTLLEPIEILPASYYQDPDSPKYGEPEYYRLQSFTISGAGTVIGVTDRRAPPPMTQLIHETRLVVFGGIRVSRFQRNVGLMGPLWGDSILVRLMEVFRDFHIAWSAAGLIATDFAQTVITIDGLKQLIAKQPQKFIDRMRALELSRSVARAALVDKDEKVERLTTSITGLAELLQAISGRTASAADMPLSLLMGNTPAGLGADASQDVRWYYDRIGSLQTRKVGPIIWFIASVVMQTIRKRRIPKKWGVRWHPLWRLTDAEKAEARLTQARTDSMYIKMGAVTSDEIRRSRFLGEYSFETQIEEHKKAPGFMAPLPPGVLPGSTPGPGGKPGAPAGGGRPGGPKAMGPNAHSVSGYARRNPAQTGLGANAKQGGDVEGTGSANRDRADADGTGTFRSFAGLPIVVESPRGTMREWTDSDGTVGHTRMLYDYGFIEGTGGADGDSVDVYCGPNQDAKDVYIVHQNHPPDYVLYDEDKVMLGFDSLNHARDAYLAHRADGERAIGGMTVMSLDRFVEMFRPAQQLDEEHSDRIEKRGAKWVVKSESGDKTLGEYDTEGEAVQRLRQVEYFKAHPDQAGEHGAEGDEKVIGSWSTQESSYQVVKPAPTPESKKEPENPLWNAPLQAGNASDK